MPSLAKAINEKCKDCTYDEVSAGTWLQQVTTCTIKDCPLHAVRPVTPKCGKRGKYDDVAIKELMQELTRIDRARATR